MLETKLRALGTKLIPVIFFLHHLNVIAILVFILQGFRKILREQV